MARQHASRARSGISSFLGGCNPTTLPPHLCVYMHVCVFIYLLEVGDLGAVVGVGHEEHHVGHARGQLVPVRVLPVRLVQHDLRFILRVCVI